ncbi:MAG: hypothetical protein Q4C47_00740 [Planctomycetia bacterium]|nr:hypothetical protein [Planctomycetia bacterium]
MSDRLDVLTRIECGWTWKNTGESRQFTDTTRIRFRRDTLSPDIVQDTDVAWFLENQTLSDHGTMVYNLASLTQRIFGKEVTFTLATAKILYIFNRSTTGTLTLGETVSNPWTGPFGMAGDTLNLSPGSPFFVADFSTGWSVDPTACHLKLSASGGDITYDIAILGTSPEWVDPSSSGSSDTSPDDCSESQTVSS